MKVRFVHQAMLAILLLCQLFVCLDFVPRFDGLVAANGRLYLSILSGEVLCLSGVRGQSLPTAGDAVVAARKITEQTQ